MKKILSIIVIAASLFVAQPPQTAQASWVPGEVFAADALGRILQIIQDIITEISGAMFKIFEINQIKAFLDGERSQANTAAFITNYGNYLFDGPDTIADNYAEAFLTDVFHGRTPGDYGYGDGVDGLYNSYLERLRLGASRAIFDGAVSSTRAHTGINITDYCDMSDGELQFFGHETDVSFTCFSSVFANTLNHPEGISRVAREAHRAELARQQQRAQIQAVSNGGILPERDSEGNIISPAISVEKTITKSVDTVLDGILTIETENPVATAVVQQIAKRIIRKASTTIDREINRVSQKVQAEQERVKRRIESAAPESRFQDPR